MKIVVVLALKLSAHLALLSNPLKKGTKVEIALWMSPWMTQKLLAFLTMIFIVHCIKRIALTIDENYNYCDVCGLFH